MNFLVCLSIQQSALILQTENSEKAPHLLNSSQEQNRGQGEVLKNASALPYDIPGFCTEQLVLDA